MSITRCVFWGLLVLISGCKFNASCGNNDNILNTRKGEKVIGEWLEKQGMPASDVDCPRDIEIQKDMTFMCSAVIENADNLKLDIQITQTSDDGDINMKHGSKILTAAVVERALAGTILDQTGKKATVDCGLRVRLAVPKSTFICDVEGENEKAQIEITIEDETGAWQAKKL